MANCADSDQEIRFHRGAMQSEWQPRTEFADLNQMFPVAAVVFDHRHSGWN